MIGRKIRRLVYTLIAVLGGAILLFCAVAPGMAERSLNRISGEALASASSTAQRLHAELEVADLHTDSLLWNRDLIDRASRGHVDVPRLLEGNVALQVFSAVIKTPRGQNYLSNTDNSDALRPLLMAQLWPLATWTGLEARAIHQAARLHATASRSNGRLVVVRTRRQLETFLVERRKGVESVAGVLAIEGLQALEGDLGAIDRLRRVGYRMMGLAHFYDNAVAGSAHGSEKGGLTGFGRRVVTRLEERAVLIDLAHASPETFRQVVGLATRPVVVSHTGVKGTCPGGRNLADDEIRGVAATGGVIGVGYWPEAVCGTAPSAVVKAMRYIADLVGVKHVALGSDYDGAVEVGFDTSQLVLLTHALLADGFSAGEVRAIMGGNVIALLLQTLPSV